MDVREKLVEIIQNSVGGCARHWAEVIADGLIANSVTVQEWISVKDRLPEDNSNVIACLWIGEESRVYPAFYAHGVWWDRVFSTPTTNTTTHWQPMPKLPQPPKGE